MLPEGRFPGLLDSALPVRLAFVLAAALAALALASGEVILIGLILGALWAWS